MEGGERRKEEERKGWGTPGRGKGLGREKKGKEEGKGRDLQGLVHVGSHPHVRNPEKIPWYNASGHNYRNSSVIVDFAMGQIPRSTERISTLSLIFLFLLLCYRI